MISLEYKAWKAQNKLFPTLNFLSSCFIPGAKNCTIINMVAPQCHVAIPAWHDSHSLPTQHQFLWTSSHCSLVLKPASECNNDPSKYCERAYYCVWLCFHLKRIANIFVWMSKMGKYELHINLIQLQLLLQLLLIILIYAYHFSFFFIFARGSFWNSWSHDVLFKNTLI